MTTFRFLLPVFVMLSALHHGQGSATTSTDLVTSTTVVASAAAADEGGNPIGQFAGYIKDSIVRTVDGCGTMYRNHQRCNGIRAKQKDHRDKIQKKLEMDGRLDPKEIKQRLKTVNGGISYEDMLPSPLAPQPDASGKENALEKLSRERSHAVIQTLLNIEKDARVVPSLSKINIFGKKAQKKTMETMGMMGALTSKILSTPCVRGPFGAQIFTNNLDHHFYSDQEFSRAENRLIGVPKSLVRGMVTIVEGPGPLASIYPNFMNRGKVITHIKKIADCDEFWSTKRLI